MMKQQIKSCHRLFLAIMMSLPMVSTAQQMMEYQLQHLPQRSSMNPAFSPIGKGYVGIPFLSGIDYSYSNNGFRYCDLFVNNSKGELTLDADNALSHLQNANHLQIRFETDWLSFGFRYHKNYFSFHMTEKAELNFFYSKKMIEFLLHGNAGSAGTTQELNPGLDFLHHREYGVKWSREFSRYITAGLAVKYLYGMENIHTSGEGIRLLTEAEDFTLHANGNYMIQTSGLDTGAFSDFSFTDYAFGKNNQGYGIDAGLIVRCTENIEITASATDIGQITFHNDVSTYNTHTDEGGFTYHGINLNEFINNDSTDAAGYMQDIVDSLQNSLNLSTEHSSYRYTLPMHLYLGASYWFTPRYRVSALFRNANYHSGNVTGYHLSFTGKSKNWLNYSIGLNRENKSPVSLGAGFTLNFRNDQVYFVSDNVAGLFNWKKSYQTAFRAGINILFGTKLKYMKQPPQPVLEEPSAQ